MKKIKVLYVGENTFAKSGFGKYSLEVLTRLAKNPNLKLAHLAGFSSIEDNNFDQIKGWLHYPVSVKENHPHFQQFQANPKNNWGYWRFERCLLDFKPDFVFTISDPWNHDFILQSPLRKFFHYAHMPTVDSWPQQTPWIENFRDCDSIFTYSDWCHQHLREAANGEINLKCSTYPGVDLNIFKPLDKKQLRTKFGIPQDAFIIGMVCRNQRRKLLAELFKMFRVYLDKYGNTDIGKRTYLYLHTSYPEPQGVGWDLPALLNEFGIGNRVYFTYYCRQSQQPFVSHFEGARTYSLFSNQMTGFCPNVGSGLTEEQLTEIHNLFDIYIQYANCEGSGMPQLEAAACGTPIAAVNYSAMADVIEKTQGIALEPASIPRDVDLGADRAVPDNKFTADALFKHLSLPNEYKEKKRKQSRQAAESYFNWDRTAKIWADHFESTQLTGLQGKWDAPIQIFNDQIPEPPPNMSNAQFIQFCAMMVTKEPDLCVKHFGLEWLNKLNSGFHPNPQEERKIVYEQFKVLGMNKIGWEKARVGMIPLNQEDWIEFAHILEGN